MYLQLYLKEFEDLKVSYAIYDNITYILSSRCIQEYIQKYFS